MELWKAGYLEAGPGVSIELSSTHSPLGKIMLLQVHGNLAPDFNEASISLLVYAPKCQHRKGAGEQTASLSH